MFVRGKIHQKTFSLRPRGLFERLVRFWVPTRAYASDQP